MRASTSWAWTGTVFTSKDTKRQDYLPLVSGNLSMAKQARDEEPVSGSGRAASQSRKKLFILLGVALPLPGAASARRRRIHVDGWGCEGG